ncbi:MAG TPA: methyl-accepting chemotaxis protein, partial [Candidatus Methylacidiphilales bacterium]
MQTLQGDRVIAVLTHILSSDPQVDAAQEKKLADIKTVGEAMEEQYRHEPLSARDVQDLKEYDDVRLAYNAEREKVLELSRAGKKAEAQEYNSRVVVPFRIALGEKTKQIFDHNLADASGSVARAEDYAVTGFTVLVGVSLFALVAGAVLAFVIIRSLKRELNSVSATLEAGSQEIVHAAEQVSSSSQSLAEGASQQAASLEETSASLEEIGSRTERNAEGAARARRLSGEARAAAEEGANRTEAMRKATGSIEEASAEMAAAIADIKKSSDDVAKILKSIDEIAFQTNILALNASVEAARAGEHGAGFAVVADEVRNLAQRSAVAAKETARLIEASVSRSERGVEVNARVGARVAEIAEQGRTLRGSLDGIVEKVREVDSLVGSIADASKEQSGGLSAINGSVSDLDKVTQANAAGAEEAAAAAEELNAQSNELRSAVGILTRLVKG